MRVSIFEAVFFERVPALAAFAALLGKPAPDGRYRRGWGPAFPARLAWLAMEAPPSLVVAAIFATSARVAGPVALVFLALWQLHYVRRAFLYPFCI